MILPIYAEGHFLIAGTTGSGKSVLIDHILREIAEDFDPRQDAIALIDPKKVDLRRWRKWSKIYADTPADALGALRAVSKTMAARYKHLQKTEAVKVKGNYIWVIIDELADLFLSDYGREIRKELQHILQLGRAANIHVIAATQAPSRKIIPAELVLNFTHRVALRCLSPIESRQIIGIVGAESLPRHGAAIAVTPDGYVKINIPPPSTDPIPKPKKR